MFKLNPNPTFWAKVPLTVPGRDKQEIVEVEFIHMNRDDLKDYFNNLEGKDDAEALGEIINNWREIDADYTAENLGRLLKNYPAAALDFFHAYRHEVLESRRKN